LSRKEGTLIQGIADIEFTFLKDAELVAESIQAVSNGRIKTGVYHANVEDGQKERLHMQWREGKVQVVCATIGPPHVSHHMDFGS
jgi:superfamily II DNA helicase RecQ